MTPTAAPLRHGPATVEDVTRRSDPARASSGEGAPLTVLVASTPITAHTLNATPIVRGLREAGARIIWYAHPPVEQHAARWAEFVPLPLETMVPAPGEATETQPGRRTFGVPDPLVEVRRMYRDDVVGTARRHVDELLGIIETHGVDLVVSDTLMLGAGIAAEITGVPWATFGDGPLQWPSPDLPPFGTGLPVMAGRAGRHRNRHVKHAVDVALFRGALRDLNRLRRDHGLWPVADLLTAGVSREAHLQGCTPSFEYPRPELPEFIHFVGALGPGSGFAPRTPQPLRRENRSRPLAFVTQGTMRPDHGELVEPASRALSAEGYEVLVAGMPAVERPGVYSVPAVDYADALAEADVFVTNGGYTGVTLALAAGTPVVQCGATEEKPDIGARLVACGAGESIRLTSPPAWVLRRAVRRVTTDPSRRLAQARLAAEFAAHDTDHLIRNALLAQVGTPASPSMDRLHR